MSKESENCAGLIEKIKSGDKTAFEQFYALTSPKVYFVAYKILNNEHDAEDAVQDTYIKFLEKIKEIDPTKSVIGWLYQVASNISKNILKKKNALVFDGEEPAFDEIPEDSPDFDPEENADRAEVCSEVMAAIDELTAEKRACIIMKYYADMSVSEIAQSLEIPENTVKSRLFVARKELKEKLENNSSTVLYSAAPVGVVIWALLRNSEAVSSAFSVSTASAGILTGIGVSSVAATTFVTTATSVASSTAVTTGTGVVAKTVALSVAQKVAVGVVATAVIGGSTAGVVTVVKNIENKETVAYVEEITTLPVQYTQEVLEIITIPSETSTATRADWSFNFTLPTRRPHTTRTEPAAATTAAHTTAALTTQAATTSIQETTTQMQTTIQAQTTTQPTTAEPTTLAKPLLIIEVTDFDDNVVDTLSLSIEPGTEMTWDYLITLISRNGYEAMAGVYGDGVGAVANSGEIYRFTAEL